MGSGLTVLRLQAVNTSLPAWPPLLVTVMRPERQLEVAWRGLSVPHWSFEPTVELGKSAAAEAHLTEIWKMFGVLPAPLASSVCCTAC